MRFRKRSSPVSDSSDTGKVDKVANVDSVANVANADEGRPDPEQGAGAADALARAEEAEAQAAEAEAAAEAARARAHAIRLRQQADTAATESETADSEAIVTEAADSEAIVTEAADSEAADTEAADSEAVDTEAAEEHAGEEAAEDETADEEYDEAVAAEAQPRTKSRRSAVKLVTATVAALAICALLAVSGYFIWHHQQALDHEQKVAKFEAAARQGVVTLMSLNFGSAQEDVQRIIDNSTGDFREEFEKQAENFTKVAQEAKVVTEADVHSTAVKSMEEDSALVLVAASSTVTNTSGADQDPRPWRLAVTMARDGDQIKMSKVEFVP